MIVFTWGEQTEKEVVYESMGKRSWRWALNVDFQSIGVWMQTKAEGDTVWRWGCDYYDACLTRHFSFGEDHLWYDGPHCSFSVGFLHLNWSGDDCKKCLKRA